MFMQRFGHEVKARHNQPPKMVLRGAKNVNRNGCANIDGYNRLVRIEMLTHCTKRNTISTKGFRGGIIKRKRKSDQCRNRQNLPGQMMMKVVACRTLK